MSTITRPRVAMRSISMPAATPQPVRKEAARVTLSDRRNSLRGPTQSKARLTVIDGPGAGATYDVLTREQPLVGISFMLHAALTVGQQCELAFDGRPQRMRGEVVRCRPISNGRYEAAVQIRK